MFSLSLHELTACVYYKLAIERGLRGSNPQAERLAHAPRARPVPIQQSSQTADLSAEDYECKDADDADIKLAIRFSFLPALRNGPHKFTFPSSISTFTGSLRWR
jgi:hypothetical protein